MPHYPRFLLIIMLLLLLGCKQFNPSKNNANDTALHTKNTERLVNEFLINGTIFNAENDIIYLYLFKDLAFKLVDSTEVLSNQFKFKGLAEQPKMYAISKSENSAKFQFLVDNSSIDLFLDNRPANSSSYSPTQVQNDYRLYTTKTTSFKDKGVRLYYEMRGDFSDEKIKELKQKRNTLFAEENAFVTKFINEHPNSYYSAIVIKNRLKTYDYKSNRPLFDTLSENLKAFPIGKHIDSFLMTKENDKSVVSTETKATKKAENKTPVVSDKEYRPKAYKISGKNQYGEAMSLNSIPKGKVILVDFWASWCVPCRATNPTLVQLHDKYNNQGFEILSVSEDKGQAEWMNAIAVDNLSWEYHILDKNKSIAFRYGVESIPFKLLIDKNGNIASEKISGRALENRIIQLLAE